MSASECVVRFDTKNPDDYRRFLAVRSLPRYSIAGRTATFPAEYAALVGAAPATVPSGRYEPSPFLFDYQRGVSEMAIRKRKFAAFLDCGLGKWLIICEYVRHALSVAGGRALVVMPKMCIPQQLAETARFYGDSMPMEYVPSGAVSEWLSLPGTGIGLTNYEAFKNPIRRGGLTVLVLDESSTLASQYGKYARSCIDLGRGLEWKLSCTGTPAPNDQIEYAAQAVFLDQCRTTNEFLARYFVNRGETGSRWEMKSHALRPFYRDLSHWCVFLSDPGAYGWKDNAGTLPPIHTHMHEIPLTEEQRLASQSATGRLFLSEAGGIGSRQKYGRIAKGEFGGRKIPSNKPAFIKDLIDGWDDQTIVWCRYNAEQNSIRELLPDCANVDGSTKDDRRVELVDDFKACRRKVLVSKPKILGYGLNLQVCKRMIFSGLEDSYLEYYQAVKRANRVGSSDPLHVHIPFTELEEPMIANVLRKADRVRQDAREQQELFKEYGRVDF